MKKLAVSLLLTVLALCLLTSAALGEDPVPVMTFSRVSSAVQYVQENAPQVLNLGNVEYTPKELLRILRAMPKDGKLLFSTTWMRTQITQDSKVIDLNNSVKEVTIDDLYALVELVPTVEKMIVSRHGNLRNSEMAGIVDSHPEIEFTWLIHFGPFSVSTAATAYSTLKIPDQGHYLVSSEMAYLRYATNLIALDLGHNRITNIDFLAPLTKLQLLILSDNQVSDISPLANMPNLQYLEMFMNPVSDLTPLSNCKYLLDLNLSGCEIADLTPLDDLQMLERFWAPRNKKTLTEEAKQHFIDTHPNCIANFTADHATADGWRQHERYKHYIRLWENQTWVPFPNDPLPTQAQ